MSVLQTKNVHYIYQSKYQKVHAVKGISYDFEEGKFYAIVGKSGCGKTTFLSMLAGLDTPTDGEVIHNGKSTTESNRDEYRLRSISLICQSYNLFPLLTVEENVMYPMLLRGEKQTDAKKASHAKLTDVGLNESYYRRLPAMLSGGEQQRVAIARALVHKPEIIFADEPTAELDTNTGLQVLKIFKELCASEGVTIVMTTHDTGLMELADQTYQLEDGEFIA